MLLRYTRLTLTLMFFVLSVECKATNIATERPNVILIMVDDFGYECVTANGGESYQTPNLDRLAATGLRFENCHVQPLCTPTRVQLMTGRYNIHNYVQFGNLPRNETTFGQLFKQAGYATAICGKWQLGKEPDAPQHFGFDESLLWQHTRRPPRYANPGLERNAAEQDFSMGEYGPQLINDFALEFISKNRSQPFLLYYPMILTHSPFQPTPDSPNWDPTISSENVQRDVKHFADMTAFTDKMVGNIIEKLEQLHIRDNTLLIFLGDNGTLGQITSQFKGQPYQGGKGSTTAHGTHVPLIVDWPAAMPEQGRVCSDLISSTDFLPTICAAAGIEIPGNVDGHSFLPQLRGEPSQPREWLYTWYSPRQRRDMTVKECVFDHHYKLYRTGEFYRYSVDTREKYELASASLSAEAAAAKSKLQAILDQFQDARPAALDFIK
ncbi:MAG: sulfatase-like hydrolase/transferase [Pirellulaceae bacterium]